MKIFKLVIIAIFVMNSSAVFGQTNDILNKTTKFQSPNKEIPRKATETEAPIELELEKIEGAIKYELEIYNDKNEKVKNLVQKNPAFSFKLPLGKYKAKMRVADERNVFGVWSEYYDLEVTVPTPKIITDEPQQLTPEKKSLRAQGVIKWERVLLAKLYRIEVFDESSNVVLKQNVRSTSVKLNLPPGLYSYQVIAIADETHESLPQEVRPLIGVDRLRIEPPKFLEDQEIKWTRHPKAETFGKLEYMPWLSENWKEIKALEFQQKNIYTKEANLVPGKYRLTIWTSAKGWIDSETTSREFIIKPQEKDLPVGSFQKNVETGSFELME